MVAMLPDELFTGPPLREYFVGHNVEHMDEIMCAVAEAERTVQAIVKEKVGKIKRPILILLLLILIIQQGLMEVNVASHTYMIHIQ
eukprot:10218971-Ditylum_brightwellii.AAC.1